MPTYYVDNCQHVKDVDGKYGMLAIYNLTLKNETGTFEAELAQKTSTPAPSGTIKGAIEAGQFGNRFRKDKPERQGTEYTSGRTPEERKSIIRQHSQHMAVMWVVTQQKKNPELNLNYEYLKGVIDWFDEDAMAHA